MSAEQRPAQEVDFVASPRVIAVGVISLAVFTAGVLWSVTILDRERFAIEPQGPAPVPKEIGQREIGIVDQPLFEGQTERSMAARQKELRRLSSYGWVDKSQGLIHIPIERAMEIVAGEGSP